MAAYTYWFGLALVLVGVEMATGTFYMLVLAAALALGGAAALAGAGVVLQFVLAGIAAVIGTLILRRRNLKHPADTHNDNLDQGQTVRVIRWNEDGTARVHYRGAEWDATTEHANTPHDVPLYIKSIQGSTLTLTQHKL